MQDVTTFNKFTDNKDQSQENHNQQPELPANGTAFTPINNIQQEEVNEGISNYNSIRDLLQDDQMFRMDCDPTFFDQMDIEDTLNNSLGLEQIKDYENEITLSDWTAVGDIEIFSELPDSLFNSQETMEKKEDTPPTSPIPAPPSPVVEEPVEVKTENTEFDLIKYIIFGDVSTRDDDSSCTSIK